MCLVLFAYRVLDDQPLIVAANRDEFYARPAAAAHRWTDAPSVFAGRDLTAHGTWLGISTKRRFATVTNFADTDPAAPKPPGSRGDLTRNFLTGTQSAAAYVRGIDPGRYQGFSLLVWDGSELIYVSNRSGNGEAKALPPGVHALANTHLDDQWPKVVRGKDALTRALCDPPDPDRLIQMLHDDHVPPDEALPQRGRAVEMERRVAPIFIRGEDYGTRASTAVIFGSRDVSFVEQGYAANGKVLGRVMEKLNYD